MPSKERSVPSHSFIVNGKRVHVECEGDVRLLWVLRDLLGIHGPKYGCGLRVCRACTSFINGKAFNPCSVPVSKIKPDDEITTIEGLAATVKQPLHPMQQAWIDHDVAQCGYCQPGQIMNAVALVQEIKAEGRSVTDADLDQIRNICRCGTYGRIREAILAGEAAMHVAEPTHKKHKKHKPAKSTHKPKHKAAKHPQHRRTPKTTRAAQPATGG
jgi:isoquinoline 1-oxidoreductase alpha subunit